MTFDEAAKILKKMYDGGTVDRDKSTQVHLFGIIYADDLAGMSLSEIVARAGLPKPYKTEIRKGIKLAKYVQAKT